MKWNNSSVTNETSVQQHDVETELTTMMRYTFGSIAVRAFIFWQPSTLCRYLQTSKTP